MRGSSGVGGRGREGGQVGGQGWGTGGGEGPEEELAAKMPILSALGLYMAMRSRIDAERASTAVSIPVKPIAHPWPRLLHACVLACRISPAQRRRENHVHVTADRVPRIGAELERLDAPAERGELIDCLRALIAARPDAGGEALVVARQAALAQPYFCR